MEKDIYIEVLEILEDYNDFKDSDILNAVHENIDVFDKKAIEGNLKKLMDEVLLELFLPNSYNAKQNNFNVPLDLSLAVTIAEYLEFRCHFEHVFHQKMRNLKQSDFCEIENSSIKDFIILKNCLFISHSFYFYGRLESIVNSETDQSGYIKIQLRIRGIEGGRINVFNTLISFGDSSSIQQVFDDRLCLFYGIISFDPNLRENIITTSRIYDLQSLYE
jgi:hypothetical protein